MHVPGEADFNLYAYVSGQALKAIDPLGLEGQYGESGPGNVPAEKDEGLRPNEVGHGGGTQQAPQFTEKEVAAAGIVAACVLTAGGACVGLSTSADSSGRADLKGDPDLAGMALMSPMGGAPAKVVEKAGAVAVRTMSKAAPAVVRSAKSLGQKLDEMYQGIARALRTGEDVAEGAGKGLTRGAREATDAVVPRVAGAERGAVGKAAESIEGYLGPGARATRNPAGDLVLESADASRKVRFDINRTAPHKSPHAHVEEFKQVKNKSVPTYKSGPVYPKDVPHE